MLSQTIHNKKIFTYKNEEKSSASVIFFYFYKDIYEIRFIFKNVCHMNMNILYDSHIFSLTIYFLQYNFFIKRNTL